MGLVRHITPYELAGPAGALSHAPPVLHLVATPLRGDEKAPRALRPWPWRAMTVSAILHLGAVGALAWWHPSSQVSAPSIVSEIVFMPGPEAGTEAPSGAVQAQESAPVEAPPEVPVASEPAPAPTVASEPVVAEVAAEPSTEPVDPLVQEIIPEPAPVEVAATHPDPLPVERAVAPPVEVSRPLPPPPSPRPAAVKSKPVEPKPPATELAPAAPAENSALVSVAAVAPAASVAPVTSAAPPAPPAELTEPPVIHEPRYRHPPTPPRFPPRALELNQQGTVVVRALVGADGTSNEIVVWHSSGYALLDQAALRAVRDWAFEPASIGGHRIASWVEVPVRFAIR